MIAAARRQLAGLGLVGALCAACTPPRPCAASRMLQASRVSLPYVGRWRVARGDTLTLPELGDRFTLTELILDTGRVETGAACRFAGTIVFAAPRAGPFTVTWVGQASQAFVYGWPADLGPFGGIGLTLTGDSLYGALLFDSRLGMQVKPGLTAQFVASRRLAQ
jgi:hypothetical protein